jgi:hypothetical protein
MAIDWLDDIKALKDMDKPVKYAIWRQKGPKDYEFMLVDLPDIEFDDIFYIECKNGFKGYSRLMDFVRNKDGSISNWQFTPTGMAKHEERDMLMRVKTKLKALDNKTNNFYVLVCLKQE